MKDLKKANEQQHRKFLKRHRAISTGNNTELSRRDFTKMMGLGAASLALPGWLSASEVSRDRPNIIFITADDMNWDSVGAFGCKVPDITPNLDKLASEGIRFNRAHVPIAVCQPCRQSILTGRYPHNNGAAGFGPIRKDVPTFNEQLHAAGYINGILGKVKHYKPTEKFYWDVAVDREELENGRDSKLYYKNARIFFAKAKAADRPFFLHANSHDPHRPFETARGSKYPVSRIYHPEEVTVPGFLPDIPDVRREVAWYFNSVHRCDETVGMLLKALRESGFKDNTIVIFLSDNGMAFPFAKTNCYLHSTKTPMLIRWPGRIKDGSVDTEHFVCGIDIMPTLLEAIGLPQVEGIDGRSFLPLLNGQRQNGRDRVFTEFHETAGRRKYPMRCVQDKRFGYIFSAWADGKTRFRNESQSGLTFNAMQQAAESDPKIAQRVKLFLFRVPEELYDFEKDPDALHNLADDPKHNELLRHMRQELLAWMEQTKDPLTPVCRKHLQVARDD